MGAGAGGPRPGPRGEARIESFSTSFFESFWVGAGVGVVAAGATWGGSSVVYFRGQFFKYLGRGQGRGAAPEDAGEARTMSFSGTIF